MIFVFYVCLFLSLATWIACLAIFYYGGRKGCAIWKKRNEQAVKHLEAELQDIEELLKNKPITQDMEAELVLRKHQILRTLAVSYPTTTKHKYDIQ